jgi:hypothetical protein
MWLRLILAFVAAGVIAEGGFWLAGHSADLVSPDAFGPCASRFAPRWGWNQSHSTVPNAKTRRILFVGNSLTFGNDLPGMLVKVASADPSAPVSLETRSITGSGVSLTGLWDEGCGPRRMATDHFDVVILQEQSFFWDTDPSGSREAAGRWFSAARSSGATPLYFQPWTGPPIRGDGRLEEGEMEQATRQIAGMYGAPLIRIGEAFNAGQSTPGAPDLFQPDRHHASEAGTWLAALVTFHALTGERPANSSWRPAGVSPEQAATIQRIADQFG